MTDKSGAHVAKAGDTDFRKKWDKQEYAERARKKDEEERERMQENEARMKQGASQFAPECSIASLNPAWRPITLNQVKHPEKGTRKTFPNQQSS